jgi:hypothetical protein
MFCRVSGRRLGEPSFASSEWHSELYRCGRPSLSLNRRVSLAAFALLQPQLTVTIACRTLSSPTVSPIGM